VVKNSADTPRSYLVETPQGVLRRNRQMHVVLPEDDNTPRTNMPVNDTDPHTESHVVQEPECSHVPAPSNVTITRYEYCLIVLLINYACGVNALRKRILLVSRLLPSFRWSFAVNTTAVY